MPRANHFVPPLLVLFLGCTALTGGAQAGWFDSEKPKPAPAQPEANEKAAPSAAANLDESIRQAMLLRLAGSYPEAIKHLSQLMMVAADDPRVVSEYGKTLAQMGRASDAVNFLTRAEQLSPADWTIYSALGVAYDQIDNQKQAEAAYGHALALKPGEPSVLNNYALSRLLAKDTAMAQSLAVKAEMANAVLKDEKIARNIAMIRATAPEALATAGAANKSEPVKPEPLMAKAAPAPQSFTPVAQQDLPHMPPPSAPKVTQSSLPAPQNRVVMQRVPVDPLAGPVASHPPRPLQPAAKPELAAGKLEPKTAAPKPAAKPEATGTAKTAANPVAKPETKIAEVKAASAETLKPAAKPEAAGTAKTAANPAAKPEAKMAEVKTAPMEKNKIAEAKPAPVKSAEAKPVVKLDIAPPTKAEAAKPAAKPEVKAASAKTTTTPDAKTETKPAGKSSIPGLRLSANAF